MNERENFINNLERARDRAYSEGREFVKLIVGDVNRILQLLKEQEAVHVKKQELVDPVLDYWRANFGSHYKCGNCGSSLGYIYESRFCKRCGREVNWGD